MLLAVMHRPSVASGIDIGRYCLWCCVIPPPTTKLQGGFFSEAHCRVSFPLLPVSSSDIPMEQIKYILSELRLTSSAFTDVIANKSRQEIQRQRRTNLLGGPVKTLVVRADVMQLHLERGARQGLVQILA